MVAAKKCTNNSGWKLFSTILFLILIAVPFLPTNVQYVVKIMLFAALAVVMGLVITAFELRRWPVQTASAGTVITFSCISIIAAICCIRALVRFGPSVLNLVITFAYAEMIFAIGLHTGSVPLFRRRKD